MNLREQERKDGLFRLTVNSTKRENSMKRKKNTKFSEIFLK